jgi:hypothetical protein
MKTTTLKSMNLSKEAFEVLFYYATLSNVFYSYAAELTQEEVEKCHFSANTINSKLAYRKQLNNKERNVLIRIETQDISNVVQRSRDITKSDKLNRALAEFRTLNQHVKYINALNAEYYDKRTKEYTLINVDNAYVLRHCKHNDSKLRHLFTKEVTEKNEFRYVEKNEVSMFKAE